MPKKSVIEEPTKLEKISGGLTATTVATLIAANSSLVAAALLPMLVNSLAAGRYQKRIKSTLEDLQTELSALEEEIRNISDNQFQFVNEALATILHTTDESKLEYLKTAVVRAIGLSELEAHETTVMSRALRDISVVEIKFLLQIDHREMIILTSAEPSEDQAADETKMFIDPNEGKAAHISGLQALGLVVPLGSGYGGTLNCRVLPVAKQLASLIRTEVDPK